MHCPAYELEDLTEDRVRKVAVPWVDACATELYKIASWASQQSSSRASALLLFLPPSSWVEFLFWLPSVMERDLEVVSWNNTFLLWLLLVIVFTQRQRNKRGRCCFWTQSSIFSYSAPIYNMLQFPSPITHRVSQPTTKQQHYYAEAFPPWNGQCLVLTRYMCITFLPWPYFWWNHSLKIHFIPYHVSQAPLLQNQRIHFKM